MVVVKTFSVMETRRDHRNSTKDTGNWENKNKKKVGRGKNKREMLAPTQTATKPHANVPQPTLVEHGRAHELDAKVFF